LRIAIVPSVKHRFSFISSLLPFLRHLLFFARR